MENLPRRLFLDFGPARLDPVLKAPTIVDDGLLRRIRTGVPENGKVRVVLDLESIGQHKVFPLNDPYRIVIDKEGKGLLQGWAVVDNVSGEDWNGVSMSLTAGTTLTFTYDLYTGTASGRDCTDCDRPCRGRG